MANVNSVVIGENRIKYYNEILKISNISRTWVFKFQNVEKRKFEEEKLNYEKKKIQYEEQETRKNKESTRKFLIGAAISFLISSLSFSSSSVSIGFLFLCITGILAYVAYGLYKKEIICPWLPPTERKFPDKFGLGIEMNSGYKVTFTAIGNAGVEALRKLQNDIEDADVKGIIYFNMNDYNINVENNDGVINTGDFASNLYQKKEGDNL